MFISLKRIDPTANPLDIPGHVDNDITMLVNEGRPIVTIVLAGQKLVLGAEEDVAALLILSHLLGMAVDHFASPETTDVDGTTDTLAVH